MIGGLALIMMLISVRGWRSRLLIVVAGGFLPVAYQIFRMGYYGLLVPGTALAKDASGKKWSQGFVYVENFNRPYQLWLPLVLLAVLGVVLLAGRGHPWWVRAPARTDQGRAARLVQSPQVVVAFFILSGLLQAAYWIRQGGDFMHGRVLLTPLFCVLAPVAVIPVVLPDRAKLTRGTGALVAGVTATVWLAVALWALWAANSPGMGADATKVTYSGIVDERRFYAQATGNAASDHRDRLPGLPAHAGGDRGDQQHSGRRAAAAVRQLHPVGRRAGDPPPADPNARQSGPHTVYFTNLGMLGMNVGLDVRVLDQIGLANPLAAHTARLEDARIGHDKNLFPDWVVADGPWLKEHPFLPPYLDEDWVAEAQAGPEVSRHRRRADVHQRTADRQRFLVQPRELVPDSPATELTGCRKFELIRCGLSEPQFSGTPYTGLPATGP